jgi:hypothetical protein
MAEISQKAPSRGEGTKRNLKHANGDGVGELNRHDIVVPVEANFEWTNTLSPKNAIFSGPLVRRFNEVQLGQPAALYCRVLTPDQTCARKNRIIEPSPKKRIIKLGAPSISRSLLQRRSQARPH